MGLCFFKQLAWKFSAETSTTLLIELIVALFAVRRANPNPNPIPNPIPNPSSNPNQMRKTMTCWDAVLILSLFPLSVAMISHDLIPRLLVDSAPVEVAMLYRAVWSLVSHSFLSLMILGVAMTADAGTRVEKRA